MVEVTGGEVTVVVEVVDGFARYPARPPTTSPPTTPAATPAPLLIAERLLSRLLMIERSLFRLSIFFRESAPDIFFDTFLPLFRLFVRSSVANANIHWSRLFKS